MISRAIGASKMIYDESIVGNRAILPPILRFSRPSTGKLVFNGLCAMETMEPAACIS
jgi:hypothetical protein